MAMTIDGSNGVTFPNSTLQTSAILVPQFRIFELTSGTTYTKSADASQLYVMVFGSTAGRTATGAGGQGGIGGAGYSETYYTSPAATYTYSVGAGGATGAAGGTSTFGAMSVTGGGVYSAATGGAGGVGSGGSFNATGGTGGNGSSTTKTGGWGGPGSSAGNGGNGGNTDGTTNGGGGGTGGNNATTITPGIAATVKAAGAFNLPFNNITRVWYAGDPGNSGTGIGVGAPAGNRLSTGTAAFNITNGVIFSNTTKDLGPTLTFPLVNSSVSNTGESGVIIVIEVVV